MKVDLHLHTTASDGILTPERLIKYVKLTNHQLISITDHDTVEGVEEAILEGERLGIEVIPGVEISTYYQGKEHHILGYYIDWKDHELLELFDSMKKVREERIKKMLRNLGIHFDIHISFDELKNSFSIKNYGRPHIALMLVKRGIVTKVQDAFEVYLKDGGPCDVPKLPFSTHAAIDMIHRKGGIAVLAHPGIHIATNTSMMDEFVAMGIDGIEVYHPMHSEELAEYYYGYAREKDLIITGGSDYHGYLNEDVFTLTIDLTSEDTSRILSRVEKPILYL